MIQLGFTPSVIGYGKNQKRGYKRILHEQAAIFDEAEFEVESF